MSVPKSKQRARRRGKHGQCLPEEVEAFWSRYWQTGFKARQFTHVQIFVAETATLNVRLEIGAVSERITVEAATD